MNKKDIRQTPKQSWKECAYLYYQLWKAAETKAEMFDKLRELLK